MIIYIEKYAKDYEQTKRILEKFKNSPVVYIDDYKNIFLKNTKNLNIKKSLVIAKLKWTCLSKSPENYWHTDTWYFFKTSLNCVFDCSYCYLKWALKNENIIIFVNYEDIKKEILETVSNSSPNKQQWFYSSDYSDILAMNSFTNFVEEFVPFFENLWKNQMMELRTKSGNIKPLLDLNFVPKNTEICFSLNPQNLIDKYEKWASNLDDRIRAINTLLEKGFKVWLRFIPLLPIKNYEKIYIEFIEYIKKKIDLSKIYSTFAGWLLYTKKDYNKILSKYPNLDILHTLELWNDDFYRENLIMRAKLYKIFKELDKKCKFCLENWNILE